jgi:hypothetical protein
MTANEMLPLPCLRFFLQRRYADAAIHSRCPLDTLHIPSFHRLASHSKFSPLGDEREVTPHASSQSATPLARDTLDVSSCRSLASSSKRRCHSAVSNVMRLECGSSSLRSNREAISFPVN